ncbi:uncharacterized protein LOC127248282 [Andrographis paniculata]|uniref:uncharacterized protein LOC127248282 n=1 Tax=Andrographis paniculata TaxID=175694 RepID=UPI0021E92066|nr:uncharacterized protein LOC127248282 [Andrographis paniculata]
MILPCESLSKKRKWDDQTISKNSGGAAAAKLPPLLDHYQSRLPLELQRCLDIKSGKLYFQNTRTNQRVDAQNLDVPPAAMSLELRLNLQATAVVRSPSWLTFDAEHQEMVAAAFRRCHMLVMMSKARPACPNCKFVQSESGPVRTSLTGG